MKLITEEEGLKLLELARESITNGKPKNLPLITGKKLGLFITIFVDGKERGCGGTPFADSSLEEMIQDLAPFVATKDPRFPKITLEELSAMKIVLSILSPPKPIDPSEIQIGIHGLIVTQGNHSALHLPHIAKEKNWNVKILLEKTCLKGGLSPDAWKEGAKACSLKTTRDYTYNIINHKWRRNDIQEFLSTMNTIGLNRA